MLGSAPKIASQAHRATRQMETLAMQDVAVTQFCNAACGLRKGHLISDLISDFMRSASLQQHNQTKKKALRVAAWQAMAASLPRKAEASPRERPQPAESSAPCGKSELDMIRHAIDKAALQGAASFLATKNPPEKSSSDQLWCKDSVAAGLPRVFTSAGDCETALSALKRDGCKPKRSPNRPKRIETSTFQQPQANHKPLTALGFSQNSHSRPQDLASSCVRNLVLTSPQQSEIVRDSMPAKSQADPFGSHTTILWEKMNKASCLSISACWHYKCLASQELRLVEVDPEEDCGAQA